MFDIFYIGDNPELAEQIPFAHQVESPDEVNATTRMYWLVDRNTRITDPTVFEFKPEDYDTVYTHHWKNASKTYGGVKLIPRVHSQGDKQVGRVVCEKSYDIVHSLAEVSDYFDDYPSASHVWCVDPEYKLADTIDWSPSDFEPEYVHCFHLRGQLRHKYPDQEGGIKLLPRNWRQCDPKYHGYLDAVETYPVLRVDDPDDYHQRDHLPDDYVWLIDSDYQIQPGTVNWVPDPFEDTYIHSFRMPSQLTDRYPSAMGGIRLVPREWRDAELKVHSHCPITDICYDVFRTDRDFNADTFQHYAAQSTTEWFWVIDSDYDFNGELRYVPAHHESEYIHVFKWGLEYRYNPSVLELWDKRVAGIYLVHRDFDITKQKLHTDVTPVYYDVFYTHNVNDYAHYAAQSRTEMFWLIDSGYVLPHPPQWVPPASEQGFINVFKVPGQLEHKYPSDITNVSDNRAGGIKLVPRNWQAAHVKYQGNLERERHVKFQVFEDLEQGIAETQHDWFWLISPDVDVLPEFDFDFIPEEWDAGKDHVWQKLNPVTGKQYDYGGVTLVARDKVPGRPKYMREPASVQRMYPVLTLTSDTDILEQIAAFEDQCEEAMYWMIDPMVDVLPDFDFSYYPTQYDTDKIHVWMHTDGTHRGVRLVPAGWFTHHDITLEDLMYNRLPDVKLMTTEATTDPLWDVAYLDSYDPDEFREAIAGSATEFLWTVDPDVLVTGDLKFMPPATDRLKPHTWQRLKPSGELHSYGGVRLWNTSLDYSDITGENLEYNRIKGLKYQREPLCKYEPYDIIFISYDEPHADEHYNYLCAYANAQRVHGVQGIYNAHRAAAELATTRMFWVVDADALIEPDFDFDYVPDVYDQRTTHVWSSRNPVTGAEYGYGGIKLFNREAVLNTHAWGLDFATGMGGAFRHVPEISCTTVFNVDPFSTWRSAFRECVKLSLQDSPESAQRLQGWLAPLMEADYASEAITGAQMALDFVKQHRDDPDQLSRINDYDFLRDHYPG